MIGAVLKLRLHLYGGLIVLYFGSGDEGTPQVHMNRVGYSEPNIAVDTTPEYHRELGCSLLSTRTAITFSPP